MRHHIGLHGRFGSRIFKLLLVLAVVLAVIYLIRRHNMLRAGVQPKPFTEDMRDIFGQLQNRLNNGDLSGMLDVALGRNTCQVQYA
jgi:hypothetical protein